LILPTPIGLDRKYLETKLKFNHILEKTETLKHFRFIIQQIDPRELAIVIDETDIVIMPANRGRSQSPYIGEHKFKRTR